jgi:hypothetical protein
VSARTFLRDSSGDAQQIKRWFVRDSSGTPQALKRAFVRDSGGVARLIFTAVQVLPISIFGEARYPQAASAGFGFLSDGTEWQQTNTTGEQETIGVWDPSGDGSNYDIRATLLSGTAPNWPGFTNTLNTWIQATPGAYTASWGLQVQQVGGGAESCVLQIDISLHGAAIAIATGQITLGVSEGAQLE